MQYSLLIFDWDGTIMDSSSRIVNCMQAAQKQAGVSPQTYNQIRQIIGLGLHQAIAQLHPDQNDDVRNQINKAYIEQFIHLNSSTSAPYPDIETMLIDLKSRGFELAVATGKSRRGLDKDLSAEVTGFSHYFHTSRTCDETRSKPDPLMLEEILLTMDTPVERALMIGDTTFDLEMAATLGMDSIGMTYGAHSVAQLKQFSPIALMDSAYSLHQWLINPDRASFDRDL